MGVPWPSNEPNCVFPVSAWASKWMTETRPQPTARATPVTSGRAMVWSPPRITGTAPERAHALDGVFESFQGPLDLTGRHLHVADVDHAQFEEGIDAQGQVGTPAVMGQVIGDANGLRSETAPRTV